MSRAPLLRPAVPMPRPGVCLGLLLGLLLGPSACSDGVPAREVPARDGDGSRGGSDPAPAPDPDAAEQARAQAEGHRAREEWQEAIAALEKAHALAPADPRIGLELAELLLANIPGASPGRALEVLDATQDDPPGSFAAQLALARATFRTHDFARCRALVEGWFQRAGGMPREVELEARYLLGSVAERQGDFDTARQHFLAAVARAPTSGLHRCRLATCLDELGQTDAAIEEFERAIRADPGLAEAFWRLAILYERVGREQDAQRARAIHFQLNRFTDSRALTEAAYRDRYAALQELARLHPAHRRGRLSLVDYQLRFEELEAARTTARQLVVEQPEDRQAWSLYLAALRRLEGDEAARRSVSAILAEIPDLPAELQKELLKIVLEGFSE